MCKSKMSINAAEPTSTPRSRRSPRKSSGETSRTIPTTSISGVSTNSVNYPTTGSSYKDSTGTSNSSKTSLSSLRVSLPENPHIYDYTEISSATNNFLAKRYSSSSSSMPSWRCIIRGKDVIVFQRKLRRSIDISELRERLSLICRSHYASIIKLLGASISGYHIYLVYDFVNGANLADCLRNPKNPNYTVLSTWISRMQIASDIAQGLDYIHNNTGLNLSLVHNHIKSSSIIITEPSFNAKICHFGTAELCGEIAIASSEDHRQNSQSRSEITEISEEFPSSSTSTPLKSSKLKRTDSRNMKIEGTRGYMSPEFQETGYATQKSDVFAFGVVMLELFSGEERLKYRFDEENGDIRRISLIETATEVMDSGSGGGGEVVRFGRLRKWMDRRLKDSFPLEIAEKMTRVALDCVQVDPEKRPDMSRVAGKISKLYLESMNWSENMRIPTDFTVSLGPRS